MGNDGGSIPGRRDLVREKPKEIKIDNEIIAKARATMCTLTKQRLQKPIVACRLGFFYNKENILKCLIEKTLPKEFNHISSLKDVVTVTVGENKKDDATFPFICPISQTEFNGLNKFILLWSCGCVVSEKAFLETRDPKKNKCQNCGVAYTKEDIISLNMTAEEQDRIKKDILKKKEEKKAKQEAKKKEKAKTEERPEEEEEKVNKKFKPDQPMHVNMLEKFDDPDFKKIQNHEQKSQTFKNLFHKDKDYKEEGGSFHRNFRHGIR